MHRIFAALCGLILAVSLASCAGAGESLQLPGYDAPAISREAGNRGFSKSLETVEDSSTSGEESPERTEQTPVPEEAERTEWEEPVIRKLRITVNGRDFAVTLTENEAAKSFAELLPMTLDMSELNGNEKYFYLDQDLPSSPSVPQGIRTGDLMLYEKNCVGLFYESFETSYRYTPLGTVDDPEGLSEALDGGSVQVSFAWE